MDKWKSILRGRSVYRSSKVYNKENAAPIGPEITGQPLSTKKQPCIPQESAPTPTTSQHVTNFAINDDVFVRMKDGRIWLGTICMKKNTHQEPRYCIRFDDDSQVWCQGDIIRKPISAESESPPQQMCIACKQTKRADVVEACERCGRGYHRSCTRETSIGSGIWWCKRCCIPMTAADVVDTSVETNIANEFSTEGPLSRSRHFAMVKRNYKQYSQKVERCCCKWCDWRRRCQSNFTVSQ